VKRETICLLVYFLQGKRDSYYNGTLCNSGFFEIILTYGYKNKYIVQYMQ